MSEFLSLSPVVPKLCLGMRPAKLCLANLIAGRGLNPRPERSTPARAGEQRTENKTSCRSQAVLGSGRVVIFPDLELRMNI